MNNKKNQTDEEFKLIMEKAFAWDALSILIDRGVATVSMKNLTSHRQKKQIIKRKNGAKPNKRSN